MDNGRKNPAREQRGETSNRTARREEERGANGCWEGDHLGDALLFRQIEQGQVCFQPSPCLHLNAELLVERDACALPLIHGLLSQAQRLGGSGTSAEGRDEVFVGHRPIVPRRGLPVNPPLHDRF
jgi:hypothetical protein